MKKLLKELEKNFFLVYEDFIFKKVVGYVYVEFYELIFSDLMFNIMVFVVFKYVEKRGIGKVLMIGVEEEVKRWGILVIRFNFVEYRVEVYWFYEYIGYYFDKM